MILMLVAQAHAQFQGRVLESKAGPSYRMNRASLHEGMVTVVVMEPREQWAAFP